MILSFLIFIFSYCTSNYQNIIDLTRKSAKKCKIHSKDYIQNENNQVKMPGTYQEENVFYKLNIPIFATDSIIVKGIAIQKNIMGIIPTDRDEFNKIIDSFTIINRETKRIYKANKLLEISDDEIYIFSVEEEKFTSVFDIKFINLSYQTIEFEISEIGIKALIEMKSDRSTHTNIYSVTIGLCYDIDKDDKYSLNNIKQFNLSKIVSLGKWNDILQYLMIGQKLYFEIKKSGFHEGTIEIIAKSLHGIGIGSVIDNILEEIFSSQIWDIYKYPYIPSGSIKVYGMVLGYECGFKISAFFKDITISLPKLGVLGGLYSEFKFAFNYDFKRKQIISNFRPIFAKPKLLYKVTTVPQMIEQIYVTFTLALSIIPFYINIDMPGVHIEFDLRLDFPFVFTFNGNSNCTKLIDFGLDFNSQLVIFGNVNISLVHTINASFIFDLFSKNLVKKCITDYTLEYKRNEIMNAQKHDEFQQYDPEKPDEVPFEHFIISPQNITGINYTAKFMHPYENGKVDVPIEWWTNKEPYRIIFSIKNGYLLSEDATKLDDDENDIYIMKTNYYYNHDDSVGYIYVPINFKRYNKGDVDFKFFGVFAMKDDNGDYMCPKTFPMTFLTLLNQYIGCIGVESTPLMIQCCNDCQHNFCYDLTQKVKMGSKYYILYQVIEYLYQYNGNPFLVPGYHVFPENIESFEIPADEYVYVPRVKCDRCDSVQFVIDNTIYNSKYWAKTNLFAPDIPINGIDYNPKYYPSFNFEMNSLKGFANKSIKVIAICNNSYKQYCYSKCIEPKGYSVIEMKDLNGINIYSGNVSIDAPLNIYEKNSLYQVIYYEDIPKNSYCSKSWNGFINVQNLSSNKLTLSIVNTSSKTKNIKAYLGNTYVPFSRTKYFSDILQFNKNFGISLPEYEGLLLEANEQIETRYVTVNYDGSVDINTDYFNESNIIIEGENLNLDKSYITSVEIIHSEFDDSGEADSSKEIGGSDETDEKHNKKQKKQTIIIVCSVIISIIFIAIVIFIVVIVLKKNQKNNSSTLKSNRTSTLESSRASTLENSETSNLENSDTSTF